MTELHKKDCVVHVAMHDRFYRESFIQKRKKQMQLWLPSGHNCPHYVHTLLVQDLQEKNEK